MRRDCQRYLIVPTMSVVEGWSLSSSHVSGEIRQRWALSCRLLQGVDAAVEMVLMDWVSCAGRVGRALDSLVLPCQCLEPLSEAGSGPGLVVAACE